MLEGLCSSSGTTDRGEVDVLWDAQRGKENAAAWKELQRSTWWCWVWDPTCSKGWGDSWIEMMWVILFRLSCSRSLASKGQNWILVCICFLLFPQAHLPCSQPSEALLQRSAASPPLCATGKYTNTPWKSGMQTPDTKPETSLRWDLTLLLVLG